MPGLALAATLASTFHGFLHNGFAKVVVASNMTKPGQFSTFDDRKKRS